MNRLQAIDGLAVERAIVMLEVVVRYLEENPVQEYTVHYDETNCDGYCLADDCRVAAEELKHAMRLCHD